MNPTEREILKECVEALQALGVMPEGYCFCGQSRDPLKPEGKHCGECRDARAALAKAEAYLAEPETITTAQLAKLIGEGEGWVVKCADGSVLSNLERDKHCHPPEFIAQRYNSGLRFAWLPVERVAPDIYDITSATSPDGVTWQIDGLVARRVQS